jgi:hypothetical protein
MGRGETGIAVTGSLRAGAGRAHPAAAPGWVAGWASSSRKRKFAPQARDPFRFAWNSTGRAAVAACAQSRVEVG